MTVAAEQTFFADAAQSVLRSLYPLFPRSGRSVNIAKLGTARLAAENADPVDATVSNEIREHRIGLASCWVGTGASRDLYGQDGLLIQFKGRMACELPLERLLCLPNELKKPSTAITEKGAGK